MPSESNPVNKKIDELHEEGVEGQVLSQGPGKEPLVVDDPAEAPPDQDLVDDKEVDAAEESREHPEPQ